MAKFFEAETVGITVRFYALNIGQVQDLPDEMEALFGAGSEAGKPFDPARFAKLQRLYLESARNGDPQVSEPSVRLVVTLENMKDVNNACLGMFERIGKVHEASKVPVLTEEVSAATPTQPQTGAPSTQESSLLPVGLTPR